MQHRLELFLLGTFHVLLDGEPVTRFEYDKVRALLAYLAVERDIPHRRDTLMVLFWPDQTDQAARKSLNQALYTLRKALGDSVAPGDRTGPFILAGRTEVQLNPEADIWSDVQAFAQGMGEPIGPQIVDFPAEKLDRQREAARLYRGDFLQGLSLPDSTAFDDWAAGQRERLHRQASEALLALAGYHERRGELAEATRCLQRQLELEPWHEEAHRQLMRVLAHQGRRSEALVQYQRCRQALESELGLEPDPETEALAEWIRQAEGSRLLHNLPDSPTLILGRDAELAILSGRLAQPDCRVLALVGPGGVGKTRLALDLARRVQARFLDGVWFVSLLDLEPGTLPLAVAAALGLTLGSRPRPLRELLDYLSEKELLLVLDNFETFPDGAGLVTEIVRHASQVKVLITSRERPALSAAFHFEVSGLQVPTEGNPAAVEASSAGQLFIQGARRVRHDFAIGSEEAQAIRSICARVDGLPLALELAAPWTRSLSCAAVLAAIDESIDFLATSYPDMPERHRRMRAVIDQSWELLTPQEQEVFSRLAVFHASFTLPAAQEVAQAGLDTLTALVDKSLLARSPADRYTLHNLLRQYAQERLVAGGRELNQACRKHATYYCRLVLAHELALGQGDPEPSVRILEPEWGNARAAWQWAVDQSDEVLLADFSDGLFWWCQWSGRYQEGKGLFQQAIDRLAPSGMPQTPWLAGVLVRAARFYTQLADYETAQALFTRSVPTLRQANQPAELAQALGYWGDLARQHGAYAEARSLLEESVAGYRNLDTPAGLARALGSLGAAVHRLGEYARAREYAQESLDLYRQAGHRWGTADALYRLGYVAYELGEFARAEGYYRESLELRRALSDPWGLARTANNLGIVYYDLGDYDRAEEYYQESLALRQELGDRRGMAVTLNNLGLIAAIRRQFEQAERLYRQSLEVCRQIDNQQGVTIALNNLGEVAAAQGRYDYAYGLHQESLALARRIGYRRSVIFALEYLGQVALELDRPEKAQQHFLEALRQAWETRAMPRVLSALYGLARWSEQVGDAHQAAALARITAAHPATEEPVRRDSAAILIRLGEDDREPASLDEALGAAVEGLLARARFGR